MSKKKKIIRTEGLKILPDGTIIELIYEIEEKQGQYICIKNKVLNLKAKFEIRGKDLFAIVNRSINPTERKA